VAARDDGPTIPIESILAERQPEGGRAQLVSDMVAAYPVATPGLRQAVLRRAASLPQAYANWLTQPVALIADDEVSRRWLTQQGDALRTLGASILVVRVHSEQRMRVLRAHRADLAMAPAFVPELVGALRDVRAAVYPLVILSDGSVKQDVRDLVNELPQSGREFP
jgi:integrating conjugative element protein (TIGR03765 family)